MSATWITGDTLEVLRAMPSASVDLVMTSPPFLALRSYLPDDDPAKVHEIGQEATPGEFLDVLLDITEELRRVLAPHGSICVELGDTYAGSGGAGGDYADDGLRDGQPAFGGSAKRKATPRSDGGRYAGGYSGGSKGHDVAGSNGAFDVRPARGGGDGWPDSKSLCLIPELYRFALAYGFNPLTGRTTPRWRIRNVVRWVRPNPPVGALGDKFRPGTSEMVIATGTDEAGRRRYFDLDAVRYSPGKPGGSATPGPRKDTGSRQDDGLPHMSNNHPAGAPPLDWWEIPTKGYKGSHYATFPTALVTRPVEAMSPRRVCVVCGEPSRRITGPASYERTDSDRVPAQLTMTDGERPAAGVNQPVRADGANTSVVRVVETIGWSCCGHGPGCTPTAYVTKVTEVEQGKAPDGSWVDLDEWDIEVEPEKVRTKRKRKLVLEHAGNCDGSHHRNGVVLDPFGGSGTTLAVATGHGRDAIGIDLDARNADLARERVGPMFFHEATVDELWPGAA